MTRILTLFKTFDIEQFVSVLLTKGLSLVVLFLVFKLLKLLAHAILRHAVMRSFTWSGHDTARQKTLSKLFHNILDYVFYFLLFYWVLSILGVPISSLLAGAGIAGVAIGLGAQGFLSDLVNGTFILIERQYDVGDFIKLDTVSGNVSSIGIRTTQIRDLDGTLHFIPNRHITIVSNRSRGDMRAQIDIPIYADSDLDRITRIINTVNQENVSRFPEIVGMPTILGPRTLPGGQFIFRIDLFVQNGMQTHIYHTFYRLYQEALVGEGITLPTAHILSRQV